MSAGAIGSSAGWASVAALAQTASSASGSSAAVATDAGSAGVSILRESIDTQANMALKLIQATMQTNITQQKMDTAQQIIDMYA